MLTKMMRVDMVVSMNLLQDHSDHNLNGSNEQIRLVQDKIVLFTTQK